MTYTQDGINYKIENDTLKGWIGTSPFKKPEWNGTSIVEGWTNEDEAQEIRATLISESSTQKELLIQQKLQDQVVSDAQLIEDETEALENAALYPFWEAGIDVIADHKYQHITDNELRLYRCVSSHTTQSNWQPQDVPALFTRVGFEDEILAWVQPTGAQDAYNIGDKVHFPTLTDAIYESTIDNNTWSPLTYPQGWQLIE